MLVGEGDGKMAKMTVNVDDIILDKTIKAEIKRLQKRIKNLEASNNRLKSKIEDQKSRDEIASRIIGTAKCMVEDFNNYACCDEYGE